MADATKPWALRGLTRSVVKGLRRALNWRADSASPVRAMLSGWGHLMPTAGRGRSQGGDAKMFFSADQQLISTLDRHLRPGDRDFALFQLVDYAIGLVHLKRTSDPNKGTNEATNKGAGELQVCTAMHEVTFGWTHYRTQKHVDVMILRVVCVAKREFSWERWLLYQQGTMRVYRMTFICGAFLLAALNLTLAQLGVTTGLLRGLIDWATLICGAASTISVMHYEASR